MPHSFHVAFGSVARTLIYAEGDIRLEFTFDIEDADAGHLILEHHSHPSVPDATYDRAFARTLEFLDSRGYVVGTGARPSAALNREPQQVLDGIASAVESLPNPLLAALKSRGQFVPPTSFEARSDTGPEIWRLWRVFEFASPQATVVFEPRLGQFGITVGAIFHGFWGNLEQTLRAISDA